eukprot:CAMPEP_0198220254 /NCGR_PEP_ID=MMETSP1445-20131203/78303_1 /TAXON_ID=36898 /ORGANISM="Pyramimonas sp., Strain CCMP2087" /LENGTH=72 /DNA_ID=CAMNT_0043897979 /DNA_START=60 /DNA_END=275 /DNA_ORIENTATION=-
MYLYVPTSLVRSCSGGAYSLAKPKSDTLTVPSEVKRRLAGLRSRCTMPSECKYFMPRAVSMPIFSTSGTLSG